MVGSSAIHQQWIESRATHQTTVTMRAAWARAGWRLVCVVLVLTLLLYTLHSGRLADSPAIATDSTTVAVPNCNPDLPLWNKTLDFDVLKFSNETGNPTGCFLVPNYIHFIRFGNSSVNYVEMICILAAFKNQRPEKIFFHYDNMSTFSGKYWDVLENTPGFKDVVTFHEVGVPDEIFGQPLSQEWKVWHGSDIVRIQTIMKYGGIFLDNDCYLIRSLDDFRRHEISINWDENQYLGTQVIVAHKDARFLKRWLECYKKYDKTQWYYNAGERPTIEVLYKEPELIHRVKVLFGADIKYIGDVFQREWKDWKLMYVVHLLIRHQYILKNLSDKAKYPVNFDEINIAYYPITFREMAYEVYDLANIKWPKKKL